tara:strand:- start:18 stop:236 length:219 start_codon:yes stop_codon:yes gene_type:complete
MKYKKKIKRIDFPVDEFISQFPPHARLEVYSFFEDNENIELSVPAVLDFLLDSFEGYEEEKEIKSLIKKLKD